jgi:predicted restriction endonuclease
MVWADHQHSEKAGKILGEVLANHALRDNPQLKQALIARFAEEASKTDSQDEIAEAKVKRARRSSRQTQVRVDIS